MIALTDIAPRVSGFLWPSKDVTADTSTGKLMRIALMTAMMSVAFEKAGGLAGFNADFDMPLLAITIGMLLTLPFVLSKKFSRIAIWIFCLLLLPSIIDSWATYANHSWLAVWTIPVAMLFARYWDSALYADYLRITLGVVMIAAFAQKALVGTYWDGSYIAYLSYYGSTTENLFQFLCTEATLQSPCGWHRFIGIFIMAWQFAVGILLILGVRSLLFLFVEISFLIGAGFYADEMNFQVLNIALLCLAFRVGMSYRLLAICVALLLIDTHGIGSFIDHVTG